MRHSLVFPCRRNEGDAPILAEYSLHEDSRLTEWSAAGCVRRSDAPPPRNQQPGNSPSALPSFTSCGTRQSPLNSGKSSRPCLRGLHDTSARRRHRRICRAVRESARGIGQDRRVHSGRKGNATLPLRSDFYGPPAV